MKISYCTTCFGRLWQLKQTIEHNLSFMKSGEFELCVLAYNDDTVEPYLNEAFAKYIADGRLKVKTHHDDYKPSDGSDFACGYVKNLSHEMGIGEVLFNLDADNFIDNAHEHLLKLKPNEIIKNIGLPDGRSGRIGVYKTLFKKVGGYRDVGCSDDGDFVLRCLRDGAKLLHMDCFMVPISND
ncbi:hypothetical protein [Acinetobacter bohemicus]|jgi:hypothetical protein|uniref:hypothetical protein n=1 Tax=Acinetobacter bohemicus TaxID=1435036 RepID=UPI004042D994